MKIAAFLALGVGAALGLVILALTGHWWLGIVGLAAIAAAWFYTGGRRPYGYAGYGEVGVFVFFGLVATLGTQYIQADTVTWPGALGAVGVGLIACALLMVNNIRDIPTDHLAGKHTLAVKLGEHRARSTYVAMIWLPLIIAVIQGFWVPWTFLTLLLLVPATMLALAVRVGARGNSLSPSLREPDSTNWATGYSLVVHSPLPVHSPAGATLPATLLCEPVLMSVVFLGALSTTL